MMAIPDENLFQKLKFDEERQHQHQSGSSKIIDPWNEQVIDSCDEQARRHEQAGTHEQAQRKRLRSPTIDDSDSSKRRKAHDNENRNFGHSSFKISNDLDSKSAPEAVWKAIEWLHADQNPLCGDCRGLNLQPTAPSSEGAIVQRPQVVGYLTEIVNRTTCPLCRLISCAFPQKAAIREVDPSISEESQEQVSLQWVDDSTETTQRLSRNLLRLTTSSNPVRQAFLLPLRKDSGESTFLGLEVKSEYIDFGKLNSWPGFNYINYKTHLDYESSETITAKRSIDPGKLIDDKYLRGFPDFADFRLIDTKSLCLVKIPIGCSPNYFTLSYVWGTEKYFRATKENIKFLEEDQSLFRPEHDLPCTIKDAIEITRILCQRHLWVDALCIVQDDDVGRAVQVKNMDRIYKNSKLTIINASGTNADSGFEGVHPHRRKIQQHIEELRPGLRVMLYQPMEEVLKLSVWQTRAWTFQEGLFSARCLIFLYGKLYFEIDNVCYSEDLSTYECNTGVLSLGLISMDPFLRFTESVSKFTERELSYESDILNAWAGTAKDFEKRLQSASFFGLPVVYFDFALLWRPSHKLTRRKGFPSWSWAGWVGKVHWEPTECRQDEHKTCILHSRPIVWYKQAHMGRYELVISQMEIEVAHPASKPNRKFGNLKPNPPNFNPNAPNVESKAKSTRFLEQQPDRATKPTKPSSFRQDFLPAVSGAPSEWPYLHFWAFSALFQLSAPIKSTEIASVLKTGFQNFALTECHDSRCGVVVLESCWEARIGELVEVLVLSDCEDWDRSDQALFNDSSRTTHARGERSLCNVMLIEWIEGDVAERVAVGKVFKSALKAAFPPGEQWKEITLG